MSNRYLPALGRRLGSTNTPLIAAAVSGLIALSLVSFRGPSASHWHVHDDHRIHRDHSHFVIAEPITPIPINRELDSGVVDLGKSLFHEPRLSADGSVSCATCHNLSEGGVDGLPSSIGIHGQAGMFNAPTVLNSSLNYWQFWDGRADSLEKQIDGPLNSPNELGNNWSAVMDFLTNDSNYSRRFNAVFGCDPTPDLVRKAIADYERSLTTPNSKFDRFLKGESAALTTQEQSGYRLFVEYRCITCHQGINVGGNSFQQLGMMADFFIKDSEMRSSDNGRFNVTGNEQDRYVFRVPPLRNVAVSAPYFHDGSVSGLNQAVEVMIQFQLGRSLILEDVDAIVAFLNTLTGELPEGVLP